MSPLKKYTAKLLFQWRTEIDGISNKMRTCEESIILIEEKNAPKALLKAKKHGKSREFQSRNDEYSIKHNCDYQIHFEFIGVSDLVGLGIECADNEVWYGVRKHLFPMENKDKFIPDENELNAIRDEQES